MKILSGSSNEELARAVSDKLHIPLIPREIFVFPDGERRVQLQNSVLAEDIIIVQSTNPPVDTHYMELFLLIDAVRRSGGNKIYIVMPYLGYQRQDHIFRDGEAVSLEVIITMLEAQNVNGIMTFDLHSIKTSELFAIPIIHLSALPIFVEIIHNQDLFNESVLVSPDMGGIRRLKIISGMLGYMPMVTIQKERDVHSGHIRISGIQGDIKRRALIVDDMVSSGKTLIQASDALKEMGAEEVTAYITHPIFSADAAIALQKSSLDKILVTDSVAVPESNRFMKLEIVSIAATIAREIREEYLA